MSWFRGTICPYCELDTGGNHQAGCPNCVSPLIPIENPTRVSIFLCGQCQRVAIDKDWRYCPYCGQRFGDW